MVQVFQVNINKIYIKIYKYNIYRQNKYRFKIYYLFR